MVAASCDLAILAREIKVKNEEYTQDSRGVLCDILW